MPGNSLKRDLQEVQQIQQVQVGQPLHAHPKEEEE